MNFSESDIDLYNYSEGNIYGHLIVDDQMILRKFSPGAMKQFDLTNGDIGKPLSAIPAIINLKTIIADIEEARHNGAVVTREIESNKKWFLLTITPSLLSNQKQWHVKVMLTDITKFKEDQVELSRKNNTLVRIIDDMENFIYSVSHDLLAPLNNIEGSISIINHIKYPDPELNKFLAIIAYSVKKFRSFIVDLSVVTRAETTFKREETINLNELLNDIEWSLENKIKSTSAVIIRDIDAEFVVFKKKNLRSILYNFISNSIKFNKASHPEIIIESKRQDDKFMISVKDNGIGIPPVAKSKIFSINARLSHDIDGNGIGLYLVKKMMDAIGGDVIVESDLDKGSKFTIIFEAL